VTNPPSPVSSTRPGARHDCTGSCTSVRIDARVGNTCHASGPRQEALRHESRPSGLLAGNHRLPALLGCRHSPRHVVMLRSEVGRPATRTRPVRPSSHHSGAVAACSLGRVSRLEAPRRSGSPDPARPTATAAILFPPVSPLASRTAARSGRCGMTRFHATSPLGRSSMLGERPARFEAVSVRASRVGRVPAVASCADRTHPWEPAIQGGRPFTGRRSAFTVGPEVDGARRKASSLGWWVKVRWASGPSPTVALGRPRTSGLACRLLVSSRLGCGASILHRP
jgi:hypothetical protein